MLRRSRSAGVALAMLVLAVALYASALALWAWADHLDGAYRVRAYPAPPKFAPIDRCHASYATPGCLP